MDDFTTQEPVIVTDPTATVKLGLEKLEQELAPILSTFLLDFRPQGIVRMQESVDAFFADRWFAHVLHDVTVEHVPGNGWLVTVAVDYDRLEPADGIDLSELHGVDFMVELSPMEDLEFLLASIEGDMTTPAQTEQTENQSSSIDDILFSPVKQKQEPVKDHSVTDVYPDMDYAIYDGCICVDCVCG